MSKVNVTYHAPAGDDRVVDTHGLTFYDGQATPVDGEEHAAFLAKARNNPHFDVDEPKAAQQASEDGKPAAPLTGLAKARAAKAAKKQQNL